MSSFTNALVLTELEGGRTFRVTTPFRFYIGARYSDLYVDVPDTFITDLTSKFIGRVLFKGNAASVVHDKVYAHGVIQAWTYQGIVRTYRVTRKQADLIYLEALKAKKVGLIKRHAYYHAVRSAGWYFWNQHRAKDSTRTPPFELLPARYKL